MLKCYIYVIGAGGGSLLREFSEYRSREGTGLPKAATRIAAGQNLWRIIGTDRKNFFVVGAKMNTFTVSIVDKS